MKKLPSLPECAKAFSACSNFSAAVMEEVGLEVGSEMYEDLCRTYKKSRVTGILKLWHCRFVPEWMVISNL